VNEIVVNYGTTITEVAKTAKASDFYNEYPELEGKRLFLFLSRIHEKKGCDLLIQAFAKVAKSNPDLHLVMAGPDQTGLLADLKKIANDFGIENRITWTGMIKNKVKWGAMKAAEVFILPSHQENFGIAVAEALAVGTPVLISNKVNIWREIKEMNAGHVEDDTFEGTQKLIQTWLDLSEDEKQTIKQNTVPCYEQKFNISQAAKNLIELLRADLGIK
jgi:glycosyltransferase involved in cell wall biosynthesis